MKTFAVRHTFENDLSPDADDELGSFFLEYLKMYDKYKLQGVSDVVLMH